MVSSFVVVFVDDVIDDVVDEDPDVVANDDEDVVTATAPAVLQTGIVTDDILTGYVAR